MRTPLGLDHAATTVDYFELLRDRALTAASHGNYAIAAALALRDRGREVVFLGDNSVFARRDPSGHAEMNAIRAAQMLSQGESGEPPTTGKAAQWSEDGSILTGDAGDQRCESVLYTTLEPCPMCTVCIITAGIRRVVIAAEDPDAGALSPKRLASLPSLWSQLAASLGLEVDFCQSQDAGQPATYVPDALRKELVGMFLESRQRLDQALVADGVLDVRSICAHADAPG